MRDRTERLRRHVDGRLRAGERVLAGVALSLPGTGAAAMSGAATASGGVHVADVGDPPAAAEPAAEALGRWPHWFLLLTTGRVELVRRSAFGRPKQPVLSLPLDRVAALTVSKQGHAVRLELADGRRLRLETPKALAFLPPVYAQLPELFAAAKAGEQPAGEL